MSRTARLLAIGLISLMLMLPFRMAAQYTFSGNESWRVRWSYIDAGGFRVIYPVGLDSVAFHYGRLFESAAQYPMDGLNVKTRPHRLTPVVLHPFSVEMNAMVSQMPLRMEYYTIPNIESVAENWPNTLVLHEGRHMAQSYKSGEHVFRPLHFLIGDMAETAGMGYLQAFNRGLLEGDAVMSETEFSLEGRGRQADFLMKYRAYFLDSVRFSYDKWHYGSYENSIPNIYSLGYLEQTYARWNRLNAAKSDTELSSETLYDGYPNPTASLIDRQMRLKLPLSRVYKNSYGNRISKNWEAASEFYTRLWQEDHALREQSDGAFDRPEILTSPEKHYVSYHYPVMTEEGGMYALRSTLGRNPYICRIYEDGSNEFICQVGYINSPLICSDNSIYWTEQIFSGRWDQESFSVLFEYNVTTGKRRQLTANSYFFNPSVSPDGGYMALVNNTPDGKSGVVVLRMGLSSRRTDYDLPDGCYAKESVWDRDNNLYVTLQSDQGLSLYKYDFLKDDWVEIMAPQHRAIRHLTSYKQYLLFDSDLNGIDNLYALNVKDGRIYRIGNAPVGSFEPCVVADEDRLCYVSYSTAGYELAGRPLKEALSEELLTEVSFSSPEPFLIDRILEAEAEVKGVEPSVFQSIPDYLKSKDYEVYPYSKMSHVLKFHSWMPLYYKVDDLAQYSSDIYNGILAPGAMLMTQNDLSTAYGQLGYSWNKGYHAAHLKFTYKGLPPVFDFTAHYNSGPSYDYETLGRNSDTIRVSGRPSLRMAARVYYPHMKYKNGWTSAFVPSLTLDFSNDLIDDVYGKFNSTPYGLLFTNGGFGHYQSKWQLAVQMYRRQNAIAGEIFPRSGLGGQLRYVAPFDFNTLFSHTVYGQFYFYLPGFGNHQSMRFTLADQALLTKDNTRWVAANLINPRGIPNMGDFICPEMQLFTFDYGLPVNLDWSIPHILYIKRLKFIPFAECLHTIERRDELNSTSTYFSAGAETMLDFVPFRISVNPQMGARVTYSTATHDWHAEMISSISF